MTAPHSLLDESQTLPPEEDGSLTLLAVATSLLRHRKLIIWIALLFVAVTATTLLLRPRTYTSSATFSPRSTKGGLGELGGLAAQLGVNVGAGGDAEQSPAFYVDLVSSRAILSRIVDSPFVETGAPAAKPQSVADLLGVKPQDPRLRREAAIEKLGKSLGSGFSQKTGVVTVSATATRPELARDLVQRVITAVSLFNQGNRQTQAGAERKFTEQRLAEARQELSAAEGREQDFLLRNREYRNAPQLLFEYDRLQREVGLRQQLYNSLAQAYDKVKIDEVRDTPNITIINSPEVPVRPDPRGLLRWSIVALLLGSLAGSAIALLLDYLASHEKDANAMEEFTALRRQAAQDFKRPWRLMRSGDRRAKVS